MQKREVKLKEDDALKYAFVFYDKWSSNEKKTHVQSLELLRKEEIYFKESMILQCSAFSLINNSFPFKSQKSFASMALALAIFDHMRRGWISLLEGYNLPSMTIARYIFEGMLFQTALGVGLASEFRVDSSKVDFIDDWLSKWWQNKLQPGNVNKLINYIDRAFTKEKAKDESQWTKRSQAMWDMLKGWAHANWVPIAMSGKRVKFNDKNPDIPAISFGGQMWNPEMCKLLGNLYLYFAVESTFALRLAFLPELYEYHEWNKRLDSLLDDYEILKKELDHML